MHEVVPMILSSVLGLIAGIVSRIQHRGSHKLILQDISVIKALKELKEPDSEAQKLASKRLIRDLNAQESQRNHKLSVLAYWTISFLVFGVALATFSYGVQGIWGKSWDLTKVTWSAWIPLCVGLLLSVWVGIRWLADRTE